MRRLLLVLAHWGASSVMVGDINGQLVQSEPVTTAASPVDSPLKRTYNERGVNDLRGSR
jgi:hypothetical protein